MHTSTLFSILDIEELVGQVVAHRFAIFLCSLDDSLVGQLINSASGGDNCNHDHHENRFSDRDPYSHHHDHDHLHGGGHPPGGVDGERCGVEGGGERDRGGDYPDHKQHHHHNKPGNILKII